MTTCTKEEPRELTMLEFVKASKGLPRTNEFTTMVGAKVRVYGDKYCTKELSGVKTYFMIR